MTETQQELLALAAKAMGCNDENGKSESRHGIYRDTEKNSPHFGMIYEVHEGGWCEWNPYTDKVQLYELAKALQLSIDFEQSYVCDGDGERGQYWPTDAGLTDADAIMMVAAEIGRQMP